MMLTRIERKLEQTFAALEPSKFPPAEFERAYKAKVKARRRRERTVGQAKQKELQAQRIEESLRKATEVSAATRQGHGAREVPRVLRLDPGHSRRSTRASTRRLVGSGYVQECRLLTAAVTACSSASLGAG